MQVRINTATGLVDSYTVGGAEQLCPGSFRFASYEDNPNPWGIGSSRRGRRQFQLLTPQEASAFSGLGDRVIPSVRVIEDGEVRTVIEVLFGLHDSKICQRYLLPKAGTAFEMETLVQWGEKEQFLRMECSTAAGEPMGQIVFGREKLADSGEEFVYQNWAAVAGEEQALAVINNGIHGGSYHMENTEGVLGLTLLRAAGYTAAGGPAGRPYKCDRYDHRMEQGQRCYRFKVAGGAKDAILHAVDTDAQSFNQPPYAMAYSPSGAGTMPERLMELDNPAVQLSAFKKAEDGKGWIVRLYEGEGKAQSAVLRLPFAGLEERIDFTPFQIKTFRLHDGKLATEDVLEGY